VAALLGDAGVVNLKPGAIGSNFTDALDEVAVGPKVEPTTEFGLSESSSVPELQFTTSK
jgi:hypothetical protein